MRSHLSSADSAQNIRSTTLVNCNPLTKNVFGFGLSVFLTWQSKKQSDEKTFQSWKTSLFVIRIRIRYSQWRPLPNLKAGTSLHPMGAWTKKSIIRLKVGFSITFIYDFNIDLYALVLIERFFLVSNLEHIPWARLTNSQLYDDLLKCRYN